MATTTPPPQELTQEYKVLLTRIQVLERKYEMLEAQQVSTGALLGALGLLFGDAGMCLRACAGGGDFTEEEDEKEYATARDANDSPGSPRGRIVRRVK